MVLNPPLIHPSARETCDKIVSSVKSSNLHFMLQETPHSVYITIRKKYVNETFAKNNDENKNKQTSVSVSQETVYENLKHESDEENRHHKEAKSHIKIIEEKPEKEKGNSNVASKNFSDGNETLTKKKCKSNKRQNKYDHGEEAVNDKRVEVTEENKLDSNQNLIEVSVPISNRFEVLSATSAITANPAPVSNMFLQSTTEKSDASKSSPASSSVPFSCSPRPSPSFTPPGTPPSTSRTLEAEIRAVIRELSVETNAMSERLCNRWK